MSLTIIKSAVDSMYFSYKGKLMEGTFTVLEALKQEAENLGSPVEIELGGEKLLLHGRGMGRFAYRLDGDGFLMKMSPKENVPRLYMEPQASLLYELGHEATFARVEAMVAQLGQLEGAKISRLDLCVDFQGFAPTIKRLNDFVSRSKYKSVIFEGKKINGFQFGRGDVVARLYNKTVEIRRSGKDWMQAVWESCPEYDGSKPVWRLEYQFRREALKQFGCDTVTDTFERLSGLFEYGLKWLSLRQPKASRDERSPVDKNWVALSGAKFPGQSCQRVRDKKHQANRHVLVRGALGYLSSLGRLYRIKDFDKLILIVSFDMRHYYGRRQSSFAEAVEKKLKQDPSYLESEHVLG